MVTYSENVDSYYFDYVPYQMSLGELTSENIENKNYIKDLDDKTYKLLSYIASLEWRE